MLPSRRDEINVQMNGQINGSVPLYIYKKIYKKKKKKKNDKKNKKKERQKDIMTTNKKKYTCYIIYVLTDHTHILIALISKR